MKQKKAIRKDAPTVEEFAAIHFTEYGNTNLERIYSVSDELDKALKGTNLGELDGHMLAVTGSDGFLFLFGPDAQKLYEYVKPIILKTPFLQNAKVGFGITGQQLKVIEQLSRAS
jgi:hypothetical protein